MSTNNNVAFRRVVWPFAIAETIMWASSYYVFPALLLEWENNFGWSKTSLVSAFTMALIFSALVAPLVGRFIDRGQAKKVFVGCALAAAFLLVLLSRVTQFWQFFAIWLMLGIAMGGMLYEATFSVLTRVMGNRAKQAITLVTLLAGFAGTISFPAAHYLAGLVGWRGALLVFAGAVVFVAVPLLWLACSNAEGNLDQQVSNNNEKTGAVRSVLRRPGFWLLGFAFATLAVNHGAIIAHLLPLLDERAFDAQTAVLVAAMIGPMQVTGRLAMMASEKYLSIFAVGYACFIALALASLFLLFSPNAPELLVGFVVLQGAGNGIVSIVRPVVTARLLGQANFGTISGMIGLPYMLGFALGPTAAALVWSISGYDLVLILTLSLTLTGLLAFAFARRLS